MPDTSPNPDVQDQAPPARFTGPVVKADQLSVRYGNNFALKDVTAVGILGASAGLAETIHRFADGSLDPRPLVHSTIGLEGLADAFAGKKAPHAGPGPKLQVDPRIP